MVPLNLFSLRCLQHFVFEQVFNFKILRYPPLLLFRLYPFIDSCRNSGRVDLAVMEQKWCLPAVDPSTAHTVNTADEYSRTLPMLTVTVAVPVASPTSVALNDRNDVLI